MGSRPGRKKLVELLKINAADFLILNAHQADENLWLHLGRVAYGCHMIGRKCELVFTGVSLGLLPIFQEQAGVGVDQESVVDFGISDLQRIYRCEAVVLSNLHECSTKILMFRTDFHYYSFDPAPCRSPVIPHPNESRQPGSDRGCLELFMFKKVFDQSGTFQAYYAAVRWLEQSGYSCGSTCVDRPCGILKGSFSIAKWRNLTKKEVAELDGKLDGDFREGPMTVYLKKAPDSEAV
jgi:hypothetical protein